MANSQALAVGLRKRPTQARAARLVEHLLASAARVLERHGARHFNTVRVAEEAGVSVGSLYQYFPNKEALLFCLQTDEWQDTWQVLEEVLVDSRLAPLERLRKLVLVFFRSEQQEAPLRSALDHAGALFRQTPEASAFLAMVKARMARFFAEALPEVPARKRDFAAELVLTSMSSLAENLTARGVTRPVVDAWAKASADMYCAYVDSLAATARQSKAEESSFQNRSSAVRSPRRSP